MGEFKNTDGYYYTYFYNHLEYYNYYSVRYDYSASYHISNCIAIGNITAEGTHSGGIAGYFRGGWNREPYYVTQAIRNSYFTGNIVATQCVGGICGELVGEGALSNNYVRAKIQGTSSVGGIVGHPELYTFSTFKSGYINFFPTIRSNMALNPSVAGTENVGRIYGSAVDGTVIGENGNAAEDNRSLYDTRIILSGVDTPVTDDAQNGVSNGDAYFKYKANYVGHGWDFNTDWTNQETETYPYKPWQAAPPTITSALESGAQSISGQSIDGGTVFVKIGNDDYVSVACSGTTWTLTGIAPLQSGVTVSLYAKTNDKEASYLTQELVSYPGSGTEADPWRVYTAADLQGVYKSGYYKQMNDIDLTAWIAENSNTTGWVAVGRTGSGQIIYDGGGFKITGLWTNSTEEYTGLFSHFDNGTIKNLNVEVASKQVKGGNNTGALIGCITNGSIENVTVTGNVQGGPIVGGVIGSTENTSVQHIAFTGKVTSATASAEVGGLVGQAGEGTILGNSSSDATVKATGSEAKAGGLIGTANATVRCCFSSGTVSGTASDSYIGGLVGQVNAHGSIENSYSTDDVSSKLYAAGLVAYNYGAIDKCYASGNVTSVYYGAGLVGYNDGTNATVTNSVALGAKVEVSDETGWGIRVLGGFKNSAPVPDESNYGWSGMQISVNGVPKIVEDNILDGQSFSNTERYAQDSYEMLYWDFDEVWTINEGTDYPQLKWPTEPVEPVNPDPQHKKGDANGDGTVNGTDIVVIANMVLGRKEKSAAGDANGDGNVNGTDIVVVANIVLGRTTSAPVRKAPAVTASGSATLSIEPLSIAAGQEATMTIDLNNPEDELTLVQFDLTLPKGVSIKTVGDDLDIDMAGRTSWRKHSLDANWNDGYYTFLLKSDSNTPISGTEGGIITVTLVADATFTGGKIVIDNTVLTTPEEVEINPARYEYSLGGDEPTPVPDGISLSIEPFSISAGSEATMTIDLNNPDTELTLVQFDLTLPAGVSIKTVGGDLDIDMAGRTNWRKHTLDANWNDGYYTFLLKSDSNTPIDGSEGGIITVTLVADATFTGGKIVIDNTVLTTPEEVEINPVRYEYNVGEVPAPSTASLTIEPFSINAGQESTMTIDLYNPDDELTLVQFDLTLPKGLSIKTVGGDLDIDMAGRTNWRKHTLDANWNDGYYTFLLKSDSNTPIDGSEGGIITVTLVADATFTGGKIVIDNTVLTTPEEVEINPARYEYELSEATGIIASVVNEKQGVVYDLQGRRVTNITRPGIYIFDGKKICVR